MNKESIFDEGYFAGKIVFPECPYTGEKAIIWWEGYYEGEKDSNKETPKGIHLLY